ncbi:MAG TPA: BTAD domain-containing putative transcriptional regulator [Jatrophihabitantaceae bacterium]|jgi:DNA-binding SARP family transcriptional activator
MMFRVLGQVAADPQTPTAGKHRALLATLLVRHNQVVSTSALIDEIWADRPPRTAATTLQVYVCHLRKLFPGDRLRTVAPGYLLRVGEDELDLIAFEAQLQRGRQAYEQADYSGAADLLGQALRLWNGPALSGVPRGEVLENAAIKLDELRLSAYEQRISADLRLGRHEEILGELISLVGEHPLRETLHAHLLVALYRSGRQADALRAFGRARRIVVDELGIEPGAGLRQLHERIVRGDPKLLWRGERPAPATVSGPVVRLPPLPIDFTGRVGELDAARRLLDQSRVLMVCGRAGVGKTTFAVRLAEQLRDSYPDGRLLVQLRDAHGAALDAQQAIGAVLRQLHQPGPPDAESLQRAVQGRRLLVILDDAASEEPVRAVASAVPETTLLVTSRGLLPGLDSARRLPLTVLRPDDATRLLVAVAGTRLDEETVRLDDATARDIARRCGHLPLALRVAGALLVMHPDWTAHDLAARLTDQEAALGVLHAGDLDVRATLMTSYRELDPADQVVFRRLALAPAPDFAPWCAAALLGVDPAVSTAAVDRLVAAQLLEPRRIGAGRTVRYGFHSLLRSLALELLADDPPHEIAAAVARMSSAYLDLARRADAALSPGRTPARYQVERTAPGATMDGDIPAVWFPGELPGLIGAMRLAYEHDQWRPVWELADSLVGYLSAAALWNEWADTHQLALDATRRAASTIAEAGVLRSLGDLAWQRRQPAAAGEHYRAARRLFQGLGNRPGQASCLVGLGDIAFGMGQPDDASRAYAAALRLGADEPRLRADTVRGLALVAERAGRRDDAFRHYEDVVRIAAKLGDRRWAEFGRRSVQRILVSGQRPGPVALEVRPGMWLVTAAG